MASSKGEEPAACIASVIYPNLRQPIVARRLAVDSGEEIRPRRRQRCYFDPEPPEHSGGRFRLGDGIRHSSGRISRKDCSHRVERQHRGSLLTKALDAGVLAPHDKQRFNAQVQRFLSVFWQVTHLNTAKYTDDYNRNAWQLDAVRQTRDFRGWRSGGWDIGADQNKDTLTGREEALLGGERMVVRQPSRHEKALPVLLRRKHEGDRLSAITLIKRIWHWAYLNNKKWDYAPSRFGIGIPGQPIYFQALSHSAARPHQDGTG